APAQRSKRRRGPGLRHTRHRRRLHVGSNRGETRFHVSLLDFPSTKVPGLGLGPEPAEGPEPERNRRVAPGAWMAPKGRPKCQEGARTAPTRRPGAVAPLDDDGESLGEFGSCHAGSPG